MFDVVAKTPAKVTTVKQSQTIAGTTNSDHLLEDSFEWTEDDMDELIITCQLSSSGKGSLTVPDPPKPKFGFSPSQITLVPETQMLSQWDTQEMNGVEKTEHAQEVPDEVEKWSLNFDEDDSLLASVAQEFELSQEAAPAPKSSAKKENVCEMFGENSSCLDGLLSSTRNSSPLTKNPVECFQKKFDENPPTSSLEEKEVRGCAGHVRDVGKQFNNLPRTQANLKKLPKKGDFARHVNDNTENLFASFCSPTPREHVRTKLSLKRSSTPKLVTSCKKLPPSNENRYSRQNVSTKLRANEEQACVVEGQLRANEEEVRANEAKLRANEGSSSPLRSIAGNLPYPEKQSWPPAVNLEKSKSGKESSSVEKGRSNLGRNEQENELDFLLCEDNFAALLDEFNFEGEYMEP